MIRDGTLEGIGLGFISLTSSRQTEPLEMRTTPYRRASSDFRCFEGFGIVARGPKTQEYRYTHMDQNSINVYPPVGKLSGYAGKQISTADATMIGSRVVRNAFCRLSTAFCRRPTRQEEQASPADCVAMIRQRGACATRRFLAFLLIAVPGGTSFQPSSRPSSFPTRQQDAVATSPLWPRYQKRSSLGYSMQWDLEDSPQSQAGDQKAQADTSNEPQRSRIVSITCQNLAGTVSPNGSPISISFEASHPFVACTGETGSGKSLLMARAIDLMTGGKATSSMVGGQQDAASTDQGEQVAIVQITLVLNDLHASFVNEVVSALGLEIGSWGNGSPPKLTLRRTLVRVPGVNGRSKTRLKSLCQVNGTTVTLKTLSTLTSPLLVVVDASVAAAALARPEIRLAILDTAVDPAVRQTFQAAQRTYRQCRTTRERIEQELANRILPQSFSMDTEEDVELMNHWIDEIEAFISRVDEFVRSLATEEGDNGSLNDLMTKLQGTDWMANAADAAKPFASAFYEILRNLRDALRSLDNQILAASNAATVLSSLSVVESAATALERARGLLYDASEGESTSDRLEESSEMSHDLLNQAEEALAKCARFVEDDESGLIVTLETMRGCCPVSVDSIDALILDWNSLARKHGISPPSLPSCHKSLIHERDGNMEALSLLPLAKSSEKNALDAFVVACDQLSLGRQGIALSLQEAVNSRLPSLGMTTSEFGVRLNQAARLCTDPPAMSGSLGLDSVEFILHHGQPTALSESASERFRGGMLHEVASSGEKARILLAIECSLPGSVRAATVSPVDVNLSPPSVPVAVVYDEIDAHVGGHAAVALGHMLADQSRQTQVMAITHSPAVAATADAHVVVEKTVEGDQTVVNVRRLDESERRKELARMASGDVAMDEAELFAQALIRDGIERRKQQKY